MPAPGGSSEHSSTWVPVSHCPIPKHLGRAHGDGGPHASHSHKEHLRSFCDSRKAPVTQSSCPVRLRGQRDVLVISASTVDTGQGGSLRGQGRGFGSQSPQADRRDTCGAPVPVLLCRAPRPDQGPSSSRGCGFSSMQSTVAHKY